MSPPSQTAISPDQGGHWLIFGGTFDPVHRGHIQLACDMKQARSARGVIVVPTRTPPHRPEKGTVASFDARTTMLRLATDDLPFVVISTIEAELPEPSYTINMLRGLKRRYPACEFSLLIGADQLEHFTDWYCWQDILAEVRLLAGSRPSYSPLLSPELPTEQIDIVPTSLLDISSSGIRAKVATGCGLEVLTQLVPRPVAEYILREKLYS